MPEPDTSWGPALRREFDARLALLRRSPRTAKAYRGWVRRFLAFHGWRRPDELGEREVTAFLSHLATARRVAVDYDPATASARISLRRTRGNWVDESQPKSITLSFEGVSSYITQPGVDSLAGDRQTIRFIGFLHPEDGTMNGFLDDLSDPTQSLIVGIEDESAVKIHADRVAIIVDA